MPCGGAEIFLAVPDAVYLLVLWNLGCAWKTTIPTYTVFISIDAYALIDAHPVHHQALGTQN